MQTLFCYVNYGVIMMAYVLYIVYESSEYIPQ
jgi:hypothetical protein